MAKRVFNFNPGPATLPLPALEALRDERFWPNIYRPDMRTVYPGLSQLWFLVAYLVHPGGFIGLQLVLLLNDLAAVGEDEVVPAA